MNNMRKIRTLVLGPIFALILLFGICQRAEAISASVYVSPASASKKVGDTFTISVGVSPSGGSVDVVDGTLSLSNLSCERVDLGSGVLPESSPSCGNLYFALGIKGGTTSSQTLFTVTVKAGSAGTGTATLSGVQAFSAGVGFSPSVANGSYAISTSCVCTAWPSWQNRGCGGGNCLVTQRLQTRTRTCTPSGCASQSESRCVNDYCGVWTNDGCGKGSCSSTKMRQTRTCTYGCLSQSQCVDDSSCVPEEEEEEEESVEEKPEEGKFEIPVDETGKTISDFSGEALEGKVTVKIPKDTICLSEEDEPVKEINIAETEIPEDIIPEGAKIVEDTAFDFGPDNTKFSRAIEIVIKYDPANIPEGGQEENLVVKKFDGESWVSCPTSIDKENHLATAEVDSFTTFALFLEEEAGPTTPSSYGILIAVLAILGITGLAIYYLRKRFTLRIVIERKARS